MRAAATSKVWKIAGLTLSPIPAVPAPPAASAEFPWVRISGQTIRGVRVENPFRAAKGGAS